MATGAANYSGSAGYKIRFIIDAWEQQTDQANNRSLVYWNAYMYRDQATSIYNNYTTYGYVNVNGTQNNGQINGYNFGVGQVYYMFNSGAQWVTHDAGGAKTVAIYGYHNADNSPYLTTVSVSTFYLTLTSFTTTTTATTSTSTSRSTSTSSTSSSTSISWTTSTSSTSSSTSSTSVSSSTSSTSSSTSQSTSTTTIRYGYQKPVNAQVRSFKPIIRAKRFR